MARTISNGPYQWVQTIGSRPMACPFLHVGLTPLARKSGPRRGQIAPRRTCRCVAIFHRPGASTHDEGFLMVVGCGGHIRFSVGPELSRTSGAFWSQFLFAGQPKTCCFRTTSVSQDDLRIDPPGPCHSNGFSGFLINQQYDSKTWARDLAVGRSKWIFLSPAGAPFLPCS